MGNVLAEAVYRFNGFTFVLCVTSGGSSVEVSDSRIHVSLPLEVVMADIDDAVLAETVASLLLVEPDEVSKGRNILLELAVRYSKRAAFLEAKRLRSRLGMLAQHAFVADIGLLAMRLSRLFRLHIWLRPLYNRAVSSGVAYLREIAWRAYSCGKRWIRLDEVVEESMAASREHGVLKAAQRVAVAARVVREAASLSLLQKLPAEMILKGLTVKPLPPLRDPMLYTRLDSARIATRLVPFEQQLYALTGVTRALRRRVSPIRSTVFVEDAGGFKAAVVKRYRDALAAKWLLVAAATLHLPKPRTRPSQRLQAEYHYNRVLSQLGFNVPEPILVDPRRLLAAYTFIEGKSLVDIVKDNPAPPEYRELGRLLAGLHSRDIALWDANPTNIIRSRDGALYIVDLEQARDTSSIEEKALDIAIAAYYSIPYSIAGATERAALLAKGYLEAGGDPEVLVEASKYRYAAPFIAATPITVLEKTRRALLHSAANR